MSVDRSKNRYRKFSKEIPLAIGTTKIALYLRINDQNCKFDKPISSKRWNHLCVKWNWISVIQPYFRRWVSISNLKCVFHVLRLHLKTTRNQMLSEKTTSNKPKSFAFPLTSFFGVFFFASLLQTDFHSLHRFLINQVEWTESFNKVETLIWHFRHWMLAHNAPRVCVCVLREVKSFLLWRDWIFLAMTVNSLQQKQQQQRRRRF